MKNCHTVGDGTYKMANLAIIYRYIFRHAMCNETMILHKRRSNNVYYQSPSPTSLLMVTGPSISSSSSSSSVCHVYQLSLNLFLCSEWSAFSMVPFVLVGLGFARKSIEEAFLVAYCHHHTTQEALQLYSLATSHAMYRRTPLLIMHRSTIECFGILWILRAFGLHLIGGVNRVISKSLCDYLSYLIVSIVFTVTERFLCKQRRGVRLKPWVRTTLKQHQRPASPNPTFHPKSSLRKSPTEIHLTPAFSMAL